MRSRVIDDGILYPCGLKLNNAIAEKLLIENGIAVDDDYFDATEQFEDCLFDKYFVDNDSNIYIDSYKVSYGNKEQRIFKSIDGSIRYTLVYDDDPKEHDNQLCSFIDTYFRECVEHRFGSVSIPIDFYNSNIADLYKAFVQLKFIPIEVDRNLSINFVCFIGLCESFDVIEEGSIIPEYDLIISTMKSGSVFAHFNKKGE